MDRAMPLLRILACTLLVSCGFFTLHILYGQGFVAEYVQNAAREGRFDELLKEPFPAWFVVIAWISALLPVSMKVCVYHYTGDLIPTKVTLLRGFIYGLVLLALGGDLVRAPLMNLLVGNPADVVVVQLSEQWVIQIGTGLLVALMVPTRTWKQ